MKKHYFGKAVAVIILVSASFYFYSPIGNQSNKSETGYIIKEQYNSQRIKHKIERRKAGYAKTDKPDKYLEYIHLIKTGGNDANNYPYNHALNELKNARLKAGQLKSTKAKFDWIERGPGNVGGRTRGFIVDPDDVNGNTWFAGPVGGGVWKTSDAGQNWECITRDWPNLAVSALAMAPSNSKVIYAGTGEGFGNLDAISGNGIFKTTDKGDTWELLTSTTSNEQFKYINRLIVHPDNESIVLAATNRGIYKTIDGGLNWTNVYSHGLRKVQDLRTHPDNFNIQFATVNNRGIVGSIDGGDSWKMIHSLEEGRIEICIAKNFPDCVYALTQESNLYLSIDGGDNWTNTLPDTKVEFLSGQGWYNNTLVGHPTDQQKIFVGGLDLYSVSIGAESSEAGQTVFDLKDQTDAFFTYKDFGGQYAGGGIKTYSTNASNLSDVEILFGSGKSQKAHRFTVNGQQNSQLQDGAFIYQNYVDVPFEVWDTKAQRQLMVSFRDQDENGAFNVGSNSLEQYFIHSDDYDANTPNPQISIDGGVSHQRVAGIFPVLRAGNVWNISSLPEMTLTLSKYELKPRSISSNKLTVWYPSNATNYAHADHHNLIIQENVGTPFRIINCNDGGIAVSDDGGTSWSSPITGYVTTQFYGVSKHPTKDMYLGGTQDNGTWISSENSQKNDAWKFQWGGDGFETVWHSSDENKLGWSLYYNGIYISHNGGKGGFEAAARGLGDADEETAPFITRLAYSRSNPDLIMTGGKSGIWKSEDFGVSWSLVKMPALTWDNGNDNPMIAISPVNSRYVWAGTTSGGTNYRPALSTDGGRSFTAVNAPTDNVMFISEILADPKEEETAYITFAEFGKPKLYKTTDFGQTWTELSGFGTGSTSSNGFPNVAVWSLLVMPHNNDIIWAGTEIGLFESLDGGLSWNFADNGLPAVSIWDMQLVGQQIIVGTHGLGVWTVDVPEIPLPGSLPVIAKSGKNSTGEFVFEFKFLESYDYVEVYVDGNLESTLNDVASGTMEHSLTKSIAKEEVSVQIAGFNGDRKSYSILNWITNVEWEQPVERYMNPFTSQLNDFVGDFNVTQSFLSDGAIHTTHPYEQASDFYYYLKYPVKVLDDPKKAIMSYRDIAFVEPGEAGSVFGSSDYYDYVVVEGSKDGMNWVPLSEGYDVNFSTKWTSYTGEDLNKAPDNSSLFEYHSIELHKTFEPDDVIMVRFRLSSDPLTTGWGWIIDDVVIQEEGTGLFNQHAAPEGTLTLVPNPVVDDFVRVKLEADAVGEVIVSVYNVNGRLELARTYNKSTSIFEETIQTGTVLEGVKIVTVAIQGDVYSQKVVFQ